MEHRQSLSLKRRIPRNIAFGIASAGLFAMVSASLLVIREFSVLEARDLHGRRIIFRTLLDRELEALRVLTKSYAEWSDTYNYVISQNEDYIESSFSESWLETFKLDLVFILNASGEILWSNEEVPTGFRPPGSLTVNPCDPLFFPADFGRLPPTPISGFRSFGDRVCIYVSWPITDDTCTCAPNGVLVFLRSLSPELLAELSPGEDFGVSYIPISAAESDYPEKIRTESGGNGKELAAYDAVPDPLGSIIGFWRFRKIRRWENQARSMAAWYILIAFIASTVGYIVTSLLINRRMVIPIMRIRDYLDSFSETFTAGDPLVPETPDEIGDLAEHVNRLTRRIEIQTKELDRLACTDGLTGLPNRRSLGISAANLERRFRPARNKEDERDASKMGFIGCGLIDIDYFKNYNDRYGHAAGDEALRRVADAIRESILRPNDTASRYGGEEFAVILPDTDEDGVIAVLERIRARVEAMALEHDASPAAPVVTISAGAAAASLSTEKGMMVETILGFADKALYAAKAAGRNRVTAFSSLSSRSI